MNDRFFVSIGLFLFLLAFSCKKEINIESRKQSLSENEFEYYFPLQTDSLDQKLNLYQQNKLEPFFNESYSNYLKNMNEPILYNKKDSGYIIRYTFLGGIFHPETYRIQKDGNNWNLYYKQIELLEENTYPIYKSSAILKDTIVRLNWHLFYQLEHKVKIFDIQHKPTHTGFGLDGDFSILEIYKNGEYHFVHRWSPRREDEAEFMDICAMIEDIYNGKLE